MVVLFHHCPFNPIVCRRVSFSPGVKSIAKDLGLKDPAIVQEQPF
jgi:hypothetical protein